LKIFEYFESDDINQRVIGLQKIWTRLFIHWYMLLLR